MCLNAFKYTFYALLNISVYIVKIKKINKRELRKSEYVYVRLTYWKYQ